MPEYRVYIVDPAGHFTDVREIYCSSDLVAVECATELTRDHTVEVWHRGRLIKKLDRARDPRGSSTDILRSPAGIRKPEGSA
jgi:hypothetical protein